MKRATAYSIFFALALSACAAPPKPATVPALPMSVGDGLGSSNGNYAARRDGEMRDETGERCFLFNWDRPLTATLALRVRSASCESRDHPNWMSAREISRTVIPLSASNLKDEPSGPP